MWGLYFFRHCDVSVPDSGEVGKRIAFSPIILFFGKTLWFRLTISHCYQLRLSPPSVPFPPHNSAHPWALPIPLSLAPQMPRRVRGGLLLEVEGAVGTYQTLQLEGYWARVSVCEMLFFTQQCQVWNWDFWAASNFQAPPFMLTVVSVLLSSLLPLVRVCEFDIFSLSVYSRTGIMI